MTAKDIIAAFETGARANRRDRYRQGNIVKLVGAGEVVMTGDLHGHEGNFDKLVRFTRLAENPQRHLILHELLHGACNDMPDECHSYRLLSRAAELKREYPDQVHFLMGNHAMAQVTRDEVLKGGQAMVRALTKALHTTYGQNTEHVIYALEEFILSMPLAASTANRIWLSHSLPSLRHLAQFDYDIFEMTLTADILRTNSSIRALIWDRTHGVKCIEELSSAWNIEVFVMGHQPQELGCGRSHERVIILASDHDHGCFLPFELERAYQPDELFGLIKPLASI